MGKKLIFIIIIECLLSCTGFSSFSKPENSDSIVVCYFKGNIIRSASVPCSLAFSRAKYLRTDTIIRLKPNEFNKIKYALENTRKVGKENDCESKFLISMDSISVCICDFNRVYNKNDEQLSFDLSIIYLVKWKSGFYNYISMDELMYFDEIKKYGIPPDYNYVLSDVKKPFRYDPTTKIVFIKE